MKYYGTFGWGHTHPVTGEDMKHYWVEIEADGIRDAHNKMYSRFDNWAMLYREDEFNKSFFPKGNYDVLHDELYINELFEEKVKYEQTGNN